MSWSLAVCIRYFSSNNLVLSLGKSYFLSYWSCFILVVCKWALIRSVRSFAFIFKYYRMSVVEFFKYACSLLLKKIPFPFNRKKKRQSGSGLKAIVSQQTFRELRLVTWLLLFRRVSRCLLASRCFLFLLLPPKNGQKPIPKWFFLTTTIFLHSHALKGCFPIVGTNIKISLLPLITLQLKRVKMGERVEEFPLFLIELLKPKVINSYLEGFYVFVADHLLA